MKKRLLSIVALILVSVFCLAAIAGCQQTAEPEVTEPEATEPETTEPEVTEPATTEPEVTEPANDTPLVVAYSPFSEKFSPFFADTAYDQDVVTMTQVTVMTTDRMGGIIYNGIEGETVPYNGTDYSYQGVADLTVDYDEAAGITTYTAKLREDIVFSDGTPMTADDLIFTYYVYLDPTYVGSTTLNSYDIVGLKDYQTQTANQAIYDKYMAMAEAILAAGAGYTATDADPFTQEQYDWMWTELNNGWNADLMGVVAYCLDNYLGSYAEAFTGKTAEEVMASEGLQIAFAMCAWGFADGFTDDTNTKWVTSSGVEFDLSTTFPTLEDFYNEAFTKYGGDPAAYFGVESATGIDFVTNAKNGFVRHWNVFDPESNADGVPNITGITKVDDYTVQVVVTGYSAPAVYSILGLSITPLHYYGDVAQYDYENNMFGHPFGDLSIVEAKTTQPMGAGPYKFIKYENKVVYYEANELYYKGAPKIKYMQFKETASNEVAAAVAAGTVDCGELTGSRANFEEVQGYNANGEITGDVISTTKVDNLGYGYIGINADTVNVGGEPFSEASRYLRWAFATLFAVHRDVAVNSYYGEAAAVINYPISNTSWAAPQPTDEGYKLAFSVDLDGNVIYTSEMTEDEKYAAALASAIGYLKAAGFTFDEATGMFTAAPNGAKLSYEIIIPADGIGDHPAFAILTDTQADLAAIGIELKINDPADANVLWDALDAGTHEMWTAAWGSTIDPDMYQVYHSSNIVGKGGSDSNHYHIAVPELDELILEARNSDDQAFRKAIYKEALELIVSEAVEIPTYQRQNCTVFSSQRINMETVTPDITTFYPWGSEIETMEMN